MSRVLITGAGGLLGSYVVPLLIEKYEVFALGRSAPTEAQAIHGDLSRPIDPATLPAQIDAIIYLAQSRRFRDFPGGAADMFQVNVAQPLALLDWGCRAGVKRFIYASSGSVYAPSIHPIGEEDPTPAPGFYASTKLAAERLTRAYEGWLDIVLLRFFFIYGRGQKRDMLLPRLVDAVRDNRAVTLQGSNGITLNPIHAADAAGATVAALSGTCSGTINVAGPERLSVREISQIAARKLGRAPRFESAAPATGDFVAETRRMAELLAPPRIHLESGIDDLI